MEYRATKCFSTRPVASIVPTASSQRKKAVPTIGCMIVAASTQMNCIARPMIADSGAIRPQRPSHLPLKPGCDQEGDASGGESDFAGNPAQAREYLHHLRDCRSSNTIRVADFRCWVGCYQDRAGTR